MKITLFAVPLILSPPAIQKIVLYSLPYNTEHIISLDIMCNLPSGSKVVGEVEGQ